MDPDSLSVGEARDRFFERLGLGPDGGYSARWVKLKAGWLPLTFPNLPSRVRAVRLHDLHHLATGYEPNWIGEAEVGAWELASGCRDYGAAWVLDFAGFAIGLILAPVRVFRAFVRGRSCRNLYASGFDERMLSETLGELRARLGLRGPARPPSAGDVALFGAWTLLAAGAVAVPVAAIGFAAAAVLRWLGWG